MNCSEAEAINNLQKLTHLESNKPGPKFCCDCFNDLNLPLYSSLYSNTTLEIPDELHTSYHERNVDIERLNKGLAKLGLSPLNYTIVREMDILGCGRRKIQQVQSLINEDISHLLG